MAYRITPKIINPIEGLEENLISHFKENSVYDGIEWGTHMGVDIKSPQETKVFAIGRGTVVYSKMHPGEISEENKLKRNWGGIVIIAHKHPATKKVFYSLYGHLGKRYVRKGDKVEMGELVGTVGKSMSESNGMWEKEHLHFAIYQGPFHGKVLPGYFKAEQEITQPEFWKEPINFIKNYNQIIPVKNDPVEERSA